MKKLSIQRAIDEIESLLNDNDEPCVTDSDSGVMYFTERGQKLLRDILKRVGKP